MLNQVCSSSLYFPLFASDIPMIPADFWCHCQCNTDDTPMWLPAIIITALLSDFMCNSALLYFQSEAMHPDCAVVVQHMKAQEECNQILKQENNHSSRTGLWVLWSRFPPCSLRLSFEKHSVLAWLMSCCKINRTEFDRKIMDFTAEFTVRRRCFFLFVTNPPPPPSSCPCTYIHFTGTH